jgi:hypothetical protein
VTDAPDSLLHNQSSTEIYLSSDNSPEIFSPARSREFIHSFTSQSASGVIKAKYTVLSDVAVILDLSETVVENGQF